MQEAAVTFAANALVEEAQNFIQVRRGQGWPDVHIVTIRRPPVLLESLSRTG